MSTYLGIDPGARGAVAALDGYGELIDVVDMPVVDKRVSPQLLRDDIVQFVGNGGETIAVVEQVSSMPGQGVASTFKFGTGYGVVLGVLAGIDVRTVHVTPASWKRAMRLSSDKEQSRRRAIDRWPASARLFARKRDEGRAEAALLALWLVERGGVA